MTRDFESGSLPPGPQRRSPFAFAFAALGVITYYYAFTRYLGTVRCTVCTHNPYFVLVCRQLTSLV